MNRISWNCQTTFSMWTNQATLCHRPVLKQIHFAKHVCISSPQEIFLAKSVLKICSKLTVEHPCQSVISTKLFCSFIEIILRYQCSPVNFQYILRTAFYKNISPCFCVWLFNQYHILQLITNQQLLQIKHTSNSKSDNCYYCAISNNMSSSYHSQN